MPCHGLDTLVAVLVVLLKVLKELTVLLAGVALTNEPNKLSGEVLNASYIKVILVRLHVAEL